MLRKCKVYRNIFAAAAAFIIILAACAVTAAALDASPGNELEPLTGYSDDSSEAFAGYTEKVFGLNAPEIYSTCAKENLNIEEQGIYSVMLGKAELIAEGSLDTAVMTVPLSRVYTAQGQFEDEKAEKTALRSVVSDSVNMGKVVRALIADNPYEFYWFLKTTGYKWEPVISERTESGCSCTALTVSMKVCSRYAGEEDFSVNTAVTALPKKAAANAKKVISEYSEFTDLEKLNAYKDYICREVSYDYDAASVSGKLTDLDPWQLIGVFDEDPGTDVVCEGYAKAFQYLCDGSEFSGNVYSILVTGNMNGLLHMWNIVTVGENSYYCDVTNSDEGAAGSSGALFLCGMRGSVSEGYSKTVSGITLTYKYDSNALLIYEEEELAVSENDLFPAPVLSARISEGSGLLEWTASEGSTSYRIYRTDVMSGKKDFLGYTAALRFSDAAPMGRTYSYTVRAYNSAERFLSVSSEPGEITLPAPQLSAPLLSARISDESVLLEWTASEGATSYRIYRTDVISGRRDFLGYTAALRFSAAAPMGRTYRYTVRAYNSVNGTFSDQSAAVIL